MKTFNLPKDHRPYIDKYFLRAKEILKKDNLDPMVRVQVFIRKGDCKVYGINEAIAILTKYGRYIKVWALKEGDHFAPSETLMIIEAPIQGIIDLETMYLGVLSAETTLKNGDKNIWTHNSIVNNMRKIVDLVKPRPVSYFGARHWRYDMDSTISRACKIGGAKNCSTDAGAKQWGEKKEGIGTIPHSLETIYHWKDGLYYAVHHTVSAFDEHMDPKIPRIALIDYANKEIEDTIRTSSLLCDNLTGIRVDTCGENIMEGGIPWHRDQYPYKYWFGNGVTATGVLKLVYALRQQIKDHPHVTKMPKITLSSGFGNPEKVKAFLDFEKEYKVKLFDSLGVGGVYESRMATADIISVAGKEIHKVGRVPRPNERLKRVA